MKRGSDLCAIVIPIYKLELSEYEIHSLRQFARVFSNRDKIVLAPERLRGSLVEMLGKQVSSLHGVQYAWFPDEFFCNVRSYNRLMLDSLFYQRFINYEYILIAQTDAFAFEDRIDEFASLGYDYFGAPWFRDYDYADEASEMLPYCGNGGFSLRRISSFLQVLKNPDHVVEPMNYFVERMRESSLKAFLLRFCDNLVDWTFHNTVKTYGGNISRYEDYFWARCARRIVPTFTSAPPDVGRRFSFETNPARLYNLNGDRLPMGCHGWWKYGFDFWKTHIGVK